MSQNIIQYAQDHQFLNIVYQFLNINDKSSDCVNITKETRIANSDEKQSRNKDDKILIMIKTQV